MCGAPPPKVMETRRKFSACLGHKKAKKGYMRVCEHTRQKAPKSRRLTDRQLTDRQIWDTLINHVKALLRVGWRNIIK
jgi:hypothetical protein